MLEKMPISMQSLSLQKQKKELEEKIIMIDKSIALMSKKHVFIAEWNIQLLNTKCLQSITEY